MNTQKTPQAHTSPLPVSYGESIMSILDKTGDADRTIHCCTSVAPQNLFMTLTLGRLETGLFQET